MPDPSELPELPPGAFAKADPSPDARFYAQPRLVTHIDAGAVAAVTRLYREVLPPGGRTDPLWAVTAHAPDLGPDAG